MVRPATRADNTNLQTHRYGHSHRPKPVENKGVTRTVKLVAAGLFCSLLYAVYKGASNPIAVKDTLRPMAVPTVDFNTLHHGEKEFGPQLSTTLECLLHQSYQPEEAQTDVKRKGTLQIVKDPIARYAFQHGIAYSELESYLDHVKDLTPQYSAPLREFPENLSAFFLNEYALVGHGESACQLTDARLVDTQTCITLIEKGIKHLALNPEQLAKAAAQASASDIGTRVSLVIQDLGTYTLRIGIDPGLHANYYRAIKKLEADWLQDPCFFERPKEEIEASILEIYKLFAGDDKAGYREQEITRKKGVDFDQAGMKKLREQTSTDPYRSQFHMELLIDSLVGDNKRLTDSLTPEELNVFKTAFHIPTQITFIPRQMLEFIAKLKEYATSDVHPVALAAWVHSQLSIIVPFSVYPNEFALLFTNAMLQLGGYQSVFIPNNDEYRLAILKDLDSPGHFAGYLASLIKTQSESQQLFSYKMQHRL